MPRPRNDSGEFGEKAANLWQMPLTTWLSGLTCAVVRASETNRFMHTWMWCSSSGLQGGTAVPTSYFGQSTGAIWLSSVNCSGSEVRLDECSLPLGWSSGQENVDCSHEEEAGIMCYTGRYTICEIMNMNKLGCGEDIDVFLMWSAENPCCLWGW